MSKKLLIGLITALFIVIVVFIYFKFFTISGNKTSSTTSQSRISTSQVQLKLNQEGIMRILVA